MTRHRHIAPILVTLLTLAALAWTTSPVTAGKAGRWAGKGAAGGAILGLLIGGDLGSAAEGAAIGAASGAATGAISSSRDRKRARQAELDQLRRQDAERKAAEARAQAEKAEQKATTTLMPADLPQTDEEWVAAIGPDNVTALDALIDCQHSRARLLAQAAATVDDRDHRLVAHWIEALVELDRRNQAEAERLYQALVPMDDDVDTLQQASLLADQALLEVRRVRSDEGGHCGA
jgi:hypothetical protein